jgi:hypothetical protein
MRKRNAELLRVVFLLILRESPDCRRHAREFLRDAGGFSAGRSAEASRSSGDAGRSAEASRSCRHGETQRSARL